MNEFYKVRLRREGAMAEPSYAVCDKPDKVVILDRDGVVNTDFGYVSTLERFEFCKGSLDALRKLNIEGYTVFVCSNQSAIGRDKASVEDVIRLMEFMRDAVSAARGCITETVFCPHHPGEDCTCRKPKSQMLSYLAEQYGFNAADAWLVGDSARDIEAGNNVGCKTIRVNGGVHPTQELKHQRPSHGYRKDLAAAVEYILEKNDLE